MIVTPDPAFWRALRARPLLSRLDAAPRELLDYVGLVNRQSGIGDVPEAVAVADDFLIDVRNAIAELPSSIRAMLEEPLLGVFFGRGLGSSALTDVVASAEGELLGAVVALDVDAFRDRKANDWATWKDNKPFRYAPRLAPHPAPRYALESIIAHDDGNNRKNAIQFMLLHEFGHVLTAVTDFLPPWWIDPRHFGSTDRYAFLALSWQVGADHQIVARPEEEFPLRRRARFSGASELSTDDLIPAYIALEQTSFPSLYGAANPYEDFAECFAGHVHNRMLHKPLFTRIRAGGQVMMRTADYWEDGRSWAKRRFFDAWLGAVSSAAQPRLTASSPRAVQAFA